MDLHKLLNEYKFYLKLEKGLSENSIKSYKNYIKSYIEIT